MGGGYRKKTHSKKTDGKKAENLSGNLTDQKNGKKTSAEKRPTHFLVFRKLDLHGKNTEKMEKRPPEKNEKFTYNYTMGKYPTYFVNSQLCIEVSFFFYSKKKISYYSGRSSCYVTYFHFTLSVAVNFIFSKPFPHVYAHFS